MCIRDRLKVIGTVTQIIDVPYKKNNAEYIKQSVFVQTKDQYNGSIAFDVFEDKLCFKEGESVDVDCNVSSAIWNGKCFHNINGWRKNQVSQPSTPVEAPASPINNSEDDNSQLPF